MNTKELLLKFSALTGVSGADTEAVKYAREMLSRLGKVQVSPLGSVICAIREPPLGKPHIMLDAHIDETGMVVTFIEDSGFLRVGAYGGVDRRVLLSSPVIAHTANGPVNGVVCSIPPHLSKENDKNKTIDEIYIDIGASSKKEAEKLVKPGDYVTLKSNPAELLNGIVSGKALDDRAGCVVILKTLALLGEDLPDCGLTAVFSSMEEVGGGGAKTAAYDVNPTHAAVVDMSFAYTPDSERKDCGELKKGPMIGFSPVLDNGMSNMLCRLAEKNGIPFQAEVMGGKTGTNADWIATSRAGVKTALLSVPLKYMHTPVESVAIDDVENTAKLLAAFVKELAQEVPCNE
ncbi:MAG: M20/M25/M40 family metallo-hydrolase [Oscillospiraceae bacterium]|nr:M20/M25/M40 family metallo-hydrolase [Oscillospiraceae bacterium]